MTPEATALAKRLVKVLGDAWSWAGIVPDEVDSICNQCEEPMRDVAGTPSPDECATTIDGADEWTCTNCDCQDWHRVLDLDHPSNEGHLHALAEKVRGGRVAPRWYTKVTEDGIEEGWSCGGRFPGKQQLWPTFSQAYAAAIVAAKEAA